jgi:IS5 family transposase
VHHRIHSTTSKKHDAEAYHDELPENRVRPLIQHRIMNPLDHAHNARMDSNRYHQQSMSETVFSSIKRTRDAAVRARAWYRKFREIVMVCAVYNIKRAVKQ